MAPQVQRPCRRHRLPPQSHMSLCEPRSGKGDRASERDRKKERERERERDKDGGNKIG